MKVDLSCPIELWEYSLPTAEKPLFSFTFFNLGERPISSIQITITCYDAHDEVISRRVERPMALDAAGREPFSVELSASDLTIDSLNLAIDKVWFEEGREWRRQQDVRLVDYEPNELPPNRTLEQLRYVAGEDAVGFPSDQGNVWICICGRVNGANEANCRRCAREKTEVFEHCTQEAVQELIDEREHELEEKARMAREEASRQEFMRQDKSRRKKRARRTRTMVIATALVVVVLSYLFIVLGLPELRYQSAMAALDSREYDAARTGFADLEDYRDAADMVYQSDLRMAEDYARSGEMAKVDRAIEVLDGMGDYPGVAEAASEAAYQKAVLYMDGKEYENASALLGTFLTYRDAEDLRDEAEYQLGKIAMDAKEYEEAVERFTALGTYLDAAALARECVYRPAMEAIADGRYDEAAEMLGTIAGYKDADVQRMQSIYQSALKAQLAGDYEYAAERFALLGNYEDSSEQMKQSVYMAGNTARDGGKYETAIKLYAAIPGYLDADDQQKACTYLPAVALMTEGRYEDAAAMFKDVPGYEDADDLYLQCVYLPAVAAADAGEYDEAIALFETIPDYNDVKRQLQQATYKRAEQLEADGELSEAIAAFEEMGDYSDAADRAKKARYALAQVTFETGNYAQALEQFAALGRYSDAATRAKECEYELGLQLLQKEDLQGAYDAFAAITDYTPARDKARETAYALGVALTAAGDLEGAANAFDLAGRYEDAAERKQDSIYQWASELAEAAEYKQAGELFNSIIGYTDARDRRDECYDLWLSGEREQANALIEAEDLQGVVDLLRTLDMEELPKAYLDLETLYLDANIKIARQLINADRALEAYGYLIEAQGYRNADELLGKNIYRILGTWETAEGERYAFYLNGTADINGERYYFNMFTPYSISVGKSNEPDDMEGMFHYTNGSEKAIQLRVEETEKVLRLTRVKPPEVSATNDSDGTAQGADPEAAGAGEPVVDIIELSDQEDPEA